MIKVLHMISDTNIGGAGKQLLNLLQYRSDSLSYAVALPKNSLLLPQIESLGVRTVPLSSLRDRSLDVAALPELLAVLQSEKPDILHTHAGFSARLAGYLLGVPVRICTKHCAYQTRKNPLVGAMQNKLSTHYIATAEAAGDVLLRQGVNKDKIHLILNGCDSAPHMKKDAIKQELGIPQNAFVVGMAARMEKGKGQETLLEAAAMCPELFFLLVGSGGEEKKLREKATAMGLSDRVLFLGFRPDIGRIMNAFDLNVNCSYLSETSSLSLSEGMSLGIVPVVSDIGGNPFMAGYGQNGAIFKAGDAEALSHTLLSLYRSPKSRAVLSERAKKRHETDFRAANMAKSTEALYLSAFPY